MLIQSSIQRLQTKLCGPPPIRPSRTLLRSTHRTFSSSRMTLYATWSNKSRMKNQMLWRFRSQPASMSLFNIPWTIQTCTIRLICFSRYAWKDSRKLRTWMSTWIMSSPAHTFWICAFKKVSSREISVRATDSIISSFERTCSKLKRRKVGEARLRWLMFRVLTKTWSLCSLRCYFDFCRMFKVAQLMARLMNWRQRKKASERLFARSCARSPRKMWLILKPWMSKYSLTRLSWLCLQQKMNLKRAIDKDFLSFGLSNDYLR